jgi:hypothetical protein
VSLQRQSFDSMARSRMMSVATVPRFPPSLLRTLRLRTVPLWCFTHCSSTTIGIDSKFACTSLPSLPLSIYQSINLSLSLCCTLLTTIAAATAVCILLLLLLLLPCMHGCSRVVNERSVYISTSLECDIPIALWLLVLV